MLVAQKRAQRKKKTNGSLWGPEAKLGKSGEEEDKEKNDANVTRGLIHQATKTQLRGCLSFLRDCRVEV